MEKRPSPRALIAVASCPTPPACVCVCERERMRWVGPMGVIEGFGDAKRHFPLLRE